MSPVAAAALQALPCMGVAFQESLYASSNKITHAIRLIDVFSPLSQPIISMFGSFPPSPLVGLRLQSLLGPGSRHCYGIITLIIGSMSAIACSIRGEVKDIFLPRLEEENVFCLLAPVRETRGWV